MRKTKTTRRASTSPEADPVTGGADYHSGLDIAGEKGQQDGGKKRHPGRVITGAVAE